jgi:hypothetical protein
MGYASNALKKLWSYESINKLRKKGCGLVNCPMGSKGRIPLREEMDRIINRDLKADGSMIE